VMITSMTTPDQHLIAQALAHPLRAQLLELLADREASPVELAPEVNAPLTHVSYHVRQLAERGLIRQTRERPVRGAVEHFYRADYRYSVEVRRA
jgi:DNA-binding transcriptional ArsR family regulator